MEKNRFSLYANVSVSVCACMNVVADSTQTYLLAFTIFSHLVYRYLFARALSSLSLSISLCVSVSLLCLLFVLCFNHPYNSSQHHRNEEEKKKKRIRVFVHIGIIRQFHFGRCLMFFFLFFVFRSFFGSVFIFIIPLLWRYSYAVGFRSSSSILLRNGQTMVAM